MLFTSPATQAMCCGPIGTTACNARPAGRFPIFTHVFQGIGWYSKTCCSAHVHYVSYILTLIRHPVITYLASIGPPIIPPPSQSQPPPHDQGSSSIERSWERRKRCPGLSSGKKGEHRSEVDRAVVSSSNNKSLHDVQYRECSIVSILPWLWVGGNTHGLRGYPEAVEALRQESCHWRTLVFGTCFSKEIFRYISKINLSIMSINQTQ